METVTLVFIYFTDHVEQLVGVLVVRPAIQWAVDINESVPVASQVIGHHVDSIQQSTHMVLLYYVSQ